MKTKNNTEMIEKAKMDTLIGSITSFLYICDVYNASRTWANLIEEVTRDEKEGLISTKNAENVKLDALRLFSNAEKRCKCYEIPDIF